ncbi:DNA repair protein RecN [Candidatus Margulisiibacteriota bacterium]
MITYVKIKNFALIDDKEIYLSKGLNILTGETGAGKTIIIDAIQFGLGEKYTRDCIKTGEDFAEVTIVADETIITRRLMKNNKSIIKLDDTVVTLDVVNDIREKMLDVVGQHEHQALFNKKYHKELIDSYGKEKTIPMLKEVKKQAEICNTIQKQIETIQNKKTSLQEIDLLKQKIKEITEIDLSKNRFEQMTDEYKKIKNSKVIKERYKSIKDSIEQVNEKIGNAKHELQKLALIETPKKEIKEKIENCIHQSTSILDEIKEFEKENELSDSQRENYEAEIDKYSKVRRKYLHNKLTKSLDEELQKELEEAQKLLDTIENREQKILNLENEYKNEKALYLKKATDVSNERKKIAKVINKIIVQELKEIGLEKIQFDTIFKIKNSVSSDGIDEIEFVISPNPGEPVKPLKQIASGGEISRIMLGIKSVLQENDTIDTIIFDEIDAGIGGETANNVGKKIHAIAQKKQIICITHLPQIAVFADTHIKIDKQFVKNKTVINIETIKNKKDREKEISRMLGDEKLKTAQEHAKEILKR